MFKTISRIKSNKEIIKNYLNMDESSAVFYPNKLISKVAKILDDEKIYYAFINKTPTCTLIVLTSKRIIIGRLLNESKISSIDLSDVVDVKFSTTTDKVFKSHIYNVKARIISTKGIYNLEISKKEHATFLYDLLIKNGVKIEKRLLTV
jgi:hypothetical protein